MLTVGIILLLIGSMVRGWAFLNHRRGPLGAAIIYDFGVLSAGFTSGAILLGLIGSILIGVQAGFWVGLISFAAFWFFSGIWAPILAASGL